MQSRNIAEIYDRHAKTVYRVCYMYVKNQADSEDMTHNVFVKLMDSERVFDSPEHEKAFLIRTARTPARTF